MHSQWKSQNFKLMGDGWGDTQVGERRGMFATQQRADIKKDSALLEAQREHAALAREQAAALFLDNAKRL